MERIALVTGANRGLGLETARQLLQRGHRVIFIARDATCRVEQTLVRKRGLTRSAKHTTIIQRVS